ncbi:hypothetical protein PSAL_008760 [Pseudooceanicola algae]|uniref:Uncharacterized protein n=1 Tax=Pseudooceanicola algae TaxID=1537215 RepID=A0A7T1BSL5_9RHOB|nr:hypothetical protein PSAL_008760 [Pseudooceanicola algae]
MALADKIICMTHGNLVQAGTPEDLYHRPATGFVAEFMGIGNLAELTLSEIRRFAVDICFSPPVALHPEKGAFFYDLQEAEISIAMEAQAARTVVLAHHAKLGVTSRVRS